MQKVRFIVEPSHVWVVSTKQSAHYQHILFGSTADIRYWLKLEAIKEALLMRKILKRVIIEIEMKINSFDNISVDRKKLQKQLNGYFKLETG